MIDWFLVLVMWLFFMAGVLAGAVYMYFMAVRQHNKRVKRIMARIQTDNETYYQGDMDFNRSEIKLDDSMSPPLRRAARKPVYFDRERMEWIPLSERHRSREASDN